MPEYLAPGVYVEEIEIGAKPIEGVGTSTAGFIGMAERGPLNKPTLVTSFAEFQRIFGSYLDKKDFKITIDQKNIYMSFLAYAVEGFFANGGKRAYIVRVAENTSNIPSLGYLPDITGMSSNLYQAVNTGEKTLKIPSSPANKLIQLTNSDSLLIQDGSQSEYMTAVGYAKVLSLDSKLENSYPNDDISKVIKLTPEGLGTPPLKSEDIIKGADTITLKSNIGSLPENSPILIKDTDPTKLEIVVLKDSVNNAKSVKLTKGLKYSHSEGTEIQKLTTTASSIRKKPIYNVDVGMKILPINVEDEDFEQNDCIRVEHGTIGPEYFIITKTTPLEAKEIWLDGEFKYKHLEGCGIQQLVPSLKVNASNQGTWGNNIKIRVKQSLPIFAATLKSKVDNQNTLNLDTINGMEKGTLLRLPTSPETFKNVTKVIKDTNQVVIDSDVTLNKDDRVSIIEFDLKVSFKGYEEIFKNLSMNPQHSRYIKKMITSETSQLITIEELTETPDPTRRLLQTNDPEPAWELNNGNNGIPTTKAELINVYKGSDDNPDPQLWTGLQAFKNIDDVNIIAIPGITVQELQNELIIHCDTLMKDRFAVLDSIENSDLTKIKEQRNLYDSKYAALYYPWLNVFDTISQNQINVPPSGHICGVYARSDTERGVHKAPANEKINGILGLEKVGNTERIITKGHQDTLNPLGINCIRSFPGRGVRVWGARTISSDSLWKYINVRRLFLYIEESIDEGTQWVVFEPNDEKLWARVKQTITQFLTQVWTDGALMGTTSEQAFFVKCDRTTMTQNDIDNGRLIVQIGVAPVKPAEFVIFRIAQWTAGAKS